LFVFRKHIPFYIKDGEEASEFRHRLMRVESVDEVKKGFQTFFASRKTPSNMV